MGKSEQQHLQLSSSVDTMVREVMTSHDPAAAVRHSKFWYTKLTCFWRTRTELEVSHQHTDKRSSTDCG